MFGFITSRLPQFNRIFGWEYKNNYPKENFICVFGHTSYFDMLIMLCSYMYYQVNLYIICNPGIMAWYYKPLRALLNIIVAPCNNKKNNNMTEVIANDFDVACKNSNKKNNYYNVLVISPKGTIGNKPWRSGYYFIAKNLGLRIFPLLYNTSTKIMELGEPVDPKTMSLTECTENLQMQLGKHNLVNNKNAEYELTCKDCQYEAFFCFDFCCVSLLSFLPYLCVLFYEGSYYMFFSGLSAVLVSWKYHMDKEGIVYAKNDLDFLKKYRKIETYYCGSMIGSHILYFYFTSGLSMVFFLLLTMGLFFYYMSTPRGNDLVRGKYVISHSFYHILMGIAAFSMLGY